MFAPNAGITISLIYFTLILGLCFWKARALKGREGRRPVGDDVKLMRQPGETLRRKIAELEEKISDRIMLLMAVPVLAAWVPLWLAKVIPQTHALGWLVWLVSAAALFVLGFVVCLGRLMVVTKELRQYRLGLAGERFVADNLAPLAAKGFAIFHDVPCQGATGMFNLDHVVVGGGGIAVIETKTRRKKKGTDEGSKKNPVTYDGSALIWPGEFRDGGSITQTVGNARWLRDHLTRELNIEVAPLPVLTVPGWWVDAKVPEPVAALNPLTLSGALPARMASTLTPQQSELIIRRLTSLCQDVEFDDPV